MSDKPKPPQTRVRSCIITHNLDDSELNKWNNENPYPMMMHDHFKYGIYQYERGLEKKHLHIQGYFEFTEKVSIACLQTMVGKKIHIDAARSKIHAAKYCEKDDSRVLGPFEKGTVKKQGERNDLKDYVEDIKNGMDDFDLMETHTNTWCRYNKLPMAVRGAVLQKKFGKAERDMEFEVYWGVTDSGKSHMARAENPDHFVLDIYNKTIWFQNYIGEKCLIIEEFYDQIPINILKRWTDKYPGQLPVKQTGSWIAWNKVIILSNHPMDEWWDGQIKREDMRALRRRITLEIEFTKKFARECPEVIGNTNDHQNNYRVLMRAPLRICAAPKGECGPNTAL